MILDSIQLFQYRLPLREDLQVGEQVLSAREGLILGLRSSTGRWGYGEVSPLPGTHRESLPQARGQLEGLVKRLRGLSLTDLEELPAGLDQHYGDLFPSVCFGIEMAVLALLAEETGRLPADLIGDEPAREVGLNALFNGGPREARRALNRGIFKPYPALKVKVGRRPLKADLEVVRTLREDCGPVMNLRLDANRAFSLARGIEFGRQVAEFGIEYLEEPLRNPENLPEFHTATGLPVALDESLWEPRFKDLHTHPAVAAHILKPQRLGILATLDHIHRFQDQDITPVISSCFESGLGCLFLVQLAAAAAPATAGLGTDRFLGADLIDPPYDSSPGVAFTDEWRNKPLLDNLQPLDWT